MEMIAFRTASTRTLLAAMAAAAALACSGQNGAPGVDGATVLLRTAPVEMGSDCASGGVRVESGLDANADGQLSDAEVQSTVFVCDGADGQGAAAVPEQPGANCAAGGVALTTGTGTTYVCNGAAGAIGQAGQDGQSVTATPEAAGASCPYGGTRLQVGGGTPTYVCDGAPGATGATGQDGQSVSMTPEPAGANCPYGGERLQIGTGTPAYVCNGAPGAAGQDGQSVTVTAEPAGDACAYGGQRLQVEGGTASYVCNGAPGATGAAGQDGQSVTMTPEPAGDACAYGGQRLQVGGGTPTYVCNGAPGATGATGQDGQSVTMTPEAAGPNCVFGGVALQVGSGPVSYLCSGAPAGVGLPSVATLDVTGIRYATALVGANVVSGGGELVFARGAVVATHPEPTLHDTIWFQGGGDGAYGVVLLELEPATTYWVRAFATNALGTGYGEVLSFTTLALTVPALSTNPAVNVTPATAISGGDVTDDGGTPILDRGVCWAVTADPALGGACASEGVGAGSFLAMATGLAASTTYHVRAYATNAQGTGYGDDRTFTTAAVPLATVITAAPSAISYTTASGGGNVTADNGATITSRGICWGTSPSPTTAGAKAVQGGTLGAFTAQLTGLTANTTYFVRAFATSGASTSYGNEVSFTTLPATVPSLSTKAVTGVSSDIAGSGGTVANDGGSAITAKGVCWSLNPNPTIANAKTADGAGSASFDSTVTGLTPLTTYHVRAYATNAIGTAYGNDLAFTTTDLVSPGTVPVVATSTVTMSTGSTAAGGGYVSADGGSSVTARGLCWSLSPGPTLANTCSTDGGTGKGFFTSTVTGLGGCAVPYYVRAYATNSFGTAYGNQVTVSTGLAPTVDTAPATDVAYYTATSGGTVTDDGGCAVTQKGVAWSLAPNPTVASPRTTDGPGGGAWVSSLTGLYANRMIYTRAYATNAAGTGYGPQVAFTTPEPAGPYLGRNYAGGIVFYVDGTGQHGLVAAPSDTGRSTWGCVGTNVGSTGTALGTGATNTASLVLLCPEANTPAKVVDNLVLGGYDDWFLPSRDELELIYANLHAFGLGGFSTATQYWTSSEYGADYAWGKYFANGSMTYWYKGNNFYFRAVRAF